MKKLLSIVSILFLTGCYGSASLIGPASGVASGKIAQSALSTSLSYAVKNKTGKFPAEHVARYAKEKNKKDKPVTTETVKCVSFLENTSPEFCDRMKKKFVSLQNSIDKSFKVKSLD